MKNVFFIFILGLFNALIYSQSNKSNVVLNNVDGRYISIYTPPNYNNKQLYKTVYVLDGNAVFKNELNFEKLLNKLIRNNKIEPIVVVGIHSSINRRSDFTPYYDSEMIDYSGGYKTNAVLFSKFIHTSLIPFIESNYSVSKKDHNRALFGFSLGGLFSLWEVTGNQKRWGMIASNSPSFWVKDYQIYKDISKNTIKTSKIWFDIGTGEWINVYSLIQVLERKKLKHGEDFYYYEIPNAKHTYEDLIRRIHNPLIVFAGSQYFDPIKLEVIVEFIPSVRQKRVIKRINPIIELKNGVKYSLSTSAKYKLLNDNDGIVYDDGRFEFYSKKPLKVRVQYKEFDKIVTLRFK